MYKNTSGHFNTALGASSLRSNTTGSENTALGGSSLFSNISGTNNVVCGYHSLYTSTGSNNTALGAYTDVTPGSLTNSTALGYNAIVDASNKVRIGNTAVTSIGGQVGWTTFSDGRYKKDIKENVPGLEFINNLRPVTYTVNVKGLNEYYNKGKTQVTDNDVTINTANAEMKEAEDAAGKIIYNGFVAQEVEQAAKKLNFEFRGVDKPDDKDGLYGLRYDNFIAPLVKAVQELSKQNDELKNHDADLQTRLEKLEAQFATLSNISKTIKDISLTDAILDQNIPNPFSNSTSIHYTLPQKFSSAQIIITDQNGKVLKQTNLSGIGKGMLNIDAAILSSGAYNYSLLVDGQVISTKKMIMAK